MKSPQPEKKRTDLPKTKPSAKTNPPATAKPPKVAFPKKSQPPTAAAFAARLPLTLGKRFEMARYFILRQKDAREDLYFYGPKTGWALRYLVGEQPLCSLLLHEDSPVGIVALSASASAAVDWKRASFTNLDMDSDMWARTVIHSSKCSSPRDVNLYNLRAGPLPSTSHSEVTQSFCSSCRSVR